MEDQEREQFLSAIDYSKAVDNVRNEHLFVTSKEMGVTEHAIGISKVIY